MKGAMKNITSKLLLTGLFSLAILFAHAQVPSKGVQKYANKKKLEKFEQQKSSIQTVSQSTVTVSKDIHKINGEASAAEGNMISTGYPYWTIAKGVHHHHSNPEYKEAYIAREK